MNNLASRLGRLERIALPSLPVCVWCEPDESPAAAIAQRYPLCAPSRVILLQWQSDADAGATT